MPHVKLEYTENVQWKNPIQDIFFKLQTALIHLEISLLSGRTKEVKTNIGKECSQIIQSFIENIAEIQVSVELRDIDRNGYFTTNQL